VSTITLPEAATSGSSWTDPTTARSSSSITAPRVRRRPDRRTYAPRRRADIASSPLSRPGYAVSSRQPGRSVADVAADIAATPQRCWEHRGVRRGPRRHRRADVSVAGQQGP